MAFWFLFLLIGSGSCHHRHEKFYEQENDEECGFHTARICRSFALPVSARLRFCFPCVPNAVPSEEEIFRISNNRLLISVLRRKKRLRIPTCISKPSHFDRVCYHFDRHKMQSYCTRTGRQNDVVLRKSCEGWAIGWYKSLRYFLL